MSKRLKHFLQLLKALSLAAFTLCSNACYSQLSTLSRPEKLWVVFHPFAAMKVRSISHECDKIYDEHETRQRLDSFPAGGKLDAYRHVFYMAAFARRVRVNKIRKLGRAHEKGNYIQYTKNLLEEGERPDSLSCEMDLRNNELGLAIGCNFRGSALPELSGIAIGAINAGKAWILLRDPEGDYITCEGKKIVQQDFARKWFVPKCLVRSDRSYNR